MKKKGFTVAEIMVAVTLMVIVVVILSNLMFTVFKNAAKAEMAKEVRQNGTYALSVMEERIKSSAKIERVTPNLELVMPSGDRIIYMLEQDPSNPDRIIEAVTPAGAFGPTYSYLTSASVNAKNLSFADETIGRTRQITIYFELEQGLKAVSAKPEDKVSMRFNLVVGNRIN